MNQSEKVSNEDLAAVDSPPLSDEMLAKMKPVKEAHPEIPPRVRGLQKSPVKIPVSIWLNPEVVEYFKSRGDVSRSSRLKTEQGETARKKDRQFGKDDSAPSRPYNN